jgi:hypothetical protein
VRAYRRGLRRFRSRPRTGHRMATRKPTRASATRTVPGRSTSRTTAPFARLSTSGSPLSISLARGQAGTSRIFLASWWTTTREGGLCSLPKDEWSAHSMNRNRSLSRTRSNAARRSRGEGPAPPSAVPRPCGTGIRRPVHHLSAQGTASARCRPHHRRPRGGRGAGREQRPQPLLDPPSCVRPASRRRISRLQRACLAAPPRGRGRPNARPSGGLSRSADPAPCAPSLAAGS